MKFDKEYSTSFIEEMQFLRKKGIRYTWVYINEDGITVWKYTKEKRLWDALSEMYSNKKICYCRFITTHKLFKIYEGWKI